MKTTCPACGAENSLDSLVGHDGARAALAELAALSGPLAGAVIRYLALFRPAKSRLSFDRVASLLADLKPMILAARVERGGRVYPAPREVWIDAIDAMLAGRDRLTLPLKSHGYLLEVIVGAAGKAEAAAEARREAGRAGHTPVGGHAARPHPGPLPAARPHPGPLPEGEGDKARASPETIARTLAAAKTLVNSQKE